MSHDSHGPHKHLMVQRDFVHKRPVNLKNLYTMAAKWLIDRGWVAVERDLEELYFEKYRENGTREYRIWWKTSKSSPDKFMKFYFDIYLMFLMVKDVERINNGKKEVIQDGEATFKFKMYLEHDEDKLKTNPYISIFYPWFKKKVIHHKEEEFEELLTKELDLFMNDLRTYLDHDISGTQRELFYPR